MEFEEVRFGMLMMVLCDREGLAYREFLTRRMLYFLYRYIYYTLGEK